MSDNNQLTRREVLLSTIGAGSATLGASGVATAASGDETRRQRGKSKKLTAEDVKEALSHAEVHPVGSNADVTARSAKLPDDLKVYYGEDKNAEVPSGKPYALESYEEFRQREVPVGFTSKDVRAAGLDSDTFYFKRDVGSVGIKEIGTELTFAFGTGVRFKASGLTEVSALLSVDVFIEIDGAGEVSIPISQFGVGYEVKDKGLCMDDLKFSHSVLRKLDIGVCVTAGLQDLSDGRYKIPIGFKASACADPCGGSWSCGYCQKVGVETKWTSPEIQI
ncbi:hypothetical protein C440_05807 [Haloferax mucosum ATCC BAA-1512]|uniref:Uncharacterized protein n=1 Tax=Haloferax mucosum ATCC BAA-1512 TaxID=662479 RepID=M0IH56_9EURY|nr:hypothetical protein [Haloferax mucosum]ELZ96081.1 hypothetical protein C440_05807 [Haloferax mucosum ATCC BAA-1512]